MRNLLSASLLALVVGLELVTLAAAGDARRAITDPAEAGADFTFQGEYGGSIRDHRYGRRYIGLQVIARGEGRFDAVRFEGGLPGSGGDPDRRTLFAGSLEDDVLHLQGDELSILVDGQKASVYDASGVPAGELYKTLRVSPTLGASPSASAIVLFDGQPSENLRAAKLTADGLLEVGATTAMPVQDFRLHMEFRLPFMPEATGQGRANSGVYIQRRYEVQILDSFGLEGAFNECGALYRQQPPDLNACLPPLTWQTYDIWFRAARFDDEGNKIANARITVLLNGVPVHRDREIVAKTGAGTAESDEPLPILFQDHGNPVHFRNMWIVLGEPTRYAVVAEGGVCRHRCFPVLRRVISRLRCRR